MFAGYVAVTVITILANAWAAHADFVRARFVLANAAEVDVPHSWIPALGALKAAGAAGLLLGLLGVPYIGVAAAVGLVLFFTGALVAHVRAGAYRKMSFPGGFFALAVASLVLAAGG
jgi:hypothetical protein